MQARPSTSTARQRLMKPDVSPGLRRLIFHDLRHAGASWHRQPGTSCDELKDLWLEIPCEVDRHAKYSTEHLSIAAARIERDVAAAWSIGTF